MKKVFKTNLKIYSKIDQKMYEKFDQNKFMISYFSIKNQHELEQSFHSSCGNELINFRSNVSNTRSKLI